MIYLDHAATTPLDPRVLEAMLPFMRDSWGNPSSPHAKGRDARAAIDESRGSIAALLGVEPHEVIFTASGSEANCLAIFGTCEEWILKKKTPGRVVLLATEHSCSIESVETLQQSGWMIDLLPVSADGIVAVETVEPALAADTALVSIHWANNEVGAVQPVEEIARLCAERNIPYHCDAVQPIGQLSLPTPLPSMMSIAAHKFYGPKGVGALIVRDGVTLQPQILGGGQEFGLRAGSENTPGIVGMAKALELAMEEQQHEAQRLTGLRDMFIADLLQLPGVSLNGHPTKRLPNDINVRFAGRRADTIVMQLDMQGICVSSGAACVTGMSETSHVLEAMGRTKVEAGENIRFSIGRHTTAEDLRTTVTALRTFVA